MNEPESSLGGRLPLIGKSELDAAQSKLYAAMDKDLIPWARKSGFEATTGDGHLIGPFNPLLYSPLIGQGFLEYLHAEREHTSLDAKVREVIILTVGAAWQSAYELYAHAAVADKAGLARETIDALATGQTPSDLSDEQRTAHEFARSLAATRQVDADLYARTEGAFGRKGVVDMAHLISLYMTTSALLNAFAVPVPR